jgi:CheY-like chemotaxis protein
LSAASRERRPEEQRDGDGSDRALGLLGAMRAFQAGDASARAPLAPPAPGEGGVAAELCRLFNAIADRTQALELEVSRLRRGGQGEAADSPDEGGHGENASASADPEQPPTILVVEADPSPAAAEPMRDAARTALRGLGGVWDQQAAASVLRVGSAEAVREAVAGHRVVSALLDARALVGTLRSVLDTLDASVPGVPLLCFAPDGDPAAYDQAEALTLGRNRAEVVRSAAQAVERLTLHWLTQAPVAPDPLAETADSGYGQIRFEGEKVLVVDDDVRNVFAMVSALELYGLTALTADNGPEGIELLLRNPDISAVLMDLMMPGLDGYATTARIRSYPEFADLPIIAVTARAAPGDRQRSLAAGTNEHVTKPVEVDQLLSLIKRLITRRGG